MHTHTLRTWVWLHKWSSLACMVFMLLLCLTGLPLIFAHEIDDWLDPHAKPRAVAPGTPRPAVQDLVATALSARPPGHVSNFIFIPRDEPDWVVVQTSAVYDPPPRQSYFHAFDRRSGELLEAEPSTTSGFLYVVRRLHVDLFAGLPGTLFLGAMGLLLVVAIVSGVVVYAPFMRKLDFATVRAARGPRVLWLDLHNLLGIVTVAWLLVVGLTGTVNTLARPLTTLWQATELQQMVEAYAGKPPGGAHLPIDRAIEAARQTWPHKRVASAFFPGTAFSGDHHYAVYMAGNTPLKSRLIAPVLVDAVTGEVTAARDMPWYSKALFVSQPLHFGDYGGLPLKLIWAGLTLLTLVVLASGIYLWVRKPAGPAAARQPHQGVT